MRFSSNPNNQPDQLGYSISIDEYERSFDQSSIPWVEEGSPLAKDCDEHPVNLGPSTKKLGKKQQKKLSDAALMKLTEFEVEISKEKHDPKRKKTKIEGFDIQKHTKPLKQDQPATNQVGIPYMYPGTRSKSNEPVVVQRHFI